MSKYGDEQAASLAAATTAKSGLQSGLTLAGADGDLVAVVIPIQYVVTVKENPASGNTTEDNRALALSLGLELYEP